jgi:Mrp family chromosome partitioning ATPase
VCQLIGGLDAGIIVTTPQDVAVLDARKSILFAKKLEMKFTGVIENMSGFTCPHCAKEIDLFDAGGGERAAQELGVEFLGRIPVEPEIVKRGDAGRPLAGKNSGSGAAKIIDEIVDKIVKLLNG